MRQRYKTKTKNRVYCMYFEKKIQLYIVSFSLYCGTCRLYHFHLLILLSLSLRYISIVEISHMLRLSFLRILYVIMYHYWTDMGYMNENSVSQNDRHFLVEQSYMAQMYNIVLPLVFSEIMYMHTCRFSDLLEITLVSISVGALSSMHHTDISRQELIRIIYFWDMVVLYVVCPS